MGTDGKEKIILWISSVTGNTKKVAFALLEVLLDHDCRPLVCGNDRHILDEAAQKYGVVTSGKTQGLIVRDTAVVFCFWCRRGSMDDASMAFLDKLDNCEIFAFGTMGSYPDSEYGKLVYDNVKDEINKRNKTGSIFLCRGQISESRTMKRRSLPVSHPHYLDDEGYLRHLSSHGHPDDVDIKRASDCLLAHALDKKEGKCLGTSPS